MATLSILRATTAALTLPAMLLAETPALPQIEQSRRAAGLPGTIDLQGQRNAPAAGTFDGTSTGDDAFGEQVIFKRQEKPQPFGAFAEIGAFMTNNVALTKEAPEEDSFVVATMGVRFSQRLGPTLRLDTAAQVAAYRYNKYPQLDFQSTDLSAGVAWAPPQLRGAEVLLRYTFTDLTTAERVREFYKNHAVLLGVQKVVPFSRAQAVYFGASAQWSFADPLPAGRDEYTGYAGYRAQLTRYVDADLFYRYGRYVYRYGSGRHDNNQTVSMALHYKAAEWLSISASGFLGFNRSNRPVYDYDAANIGVGLQFSLQF